MICSVEGCSASSARDNGGRKGMCGVHYQRLRRHGDPNKEPWGSERIDWLKSQISFDNDECLIWPYPLDSTGYAAISRNGAKTHAHRLMCELVNGAAPSNRHQAAHSCGNRACCNPKHLSWKTQSENELDKIDHGRSNRGERGGSSKLTRDDIIFIRSAKGIKQRELAEMFGVSRGHIASLQAGRFWPHIQSQQP